jgi:predicted phosphodiesterase
MELRLHSDLHLEAFMGTSLEKLEEKFIPRGENEHEQILVLAGDICSVPEKTKLFINQIRHRFKHVIYVPGNHEFYRSTTTNVFDELTKMQEFYGDLVSIAHDERMFCKVIDGVRFIYGTLWTDPFADGYRPLDVKYYMNDFRVIYDMTLERMAELHFAQKNALSNFLYEPFDGKTVVITHHLPSFSLCHPRFGGTSDHGFASNCDAVLNSGDVDVWMFGHTHDRISKTIGKTRVECNPTGYRGEWDNTFSGGGVVVVNI